MNLFLFLGWDASVDVTQLFLLFGVSGLRFNSIQSAPSCSSLQEESS
jgi:hypothetical protein